MKSILSLFFLLCITTSVFSQDSDCSDFKNGAFYYPSLEGKLSVRENNVQKSFSDNKLEMIWDVKWIDDCEYELICKKMLVDYYPTKIGDRIHVTIVATNGDCFTSDLIVYNEKSPEGFTITDAVMCRK